ncbi:MAG TPA: radical SAM protein [Paraburkholderia sp.]|jgi:MoaA/NifB/PqqE/SkfB family radical SAM enzyme|nr:radical SAM protein [Paraburkholderia sp.]
MDARVQIDDMLDAGYDAANGHASRTAVPAVCDVSVTNVCNAACDFCGFSRDRKLAGPRRYLELEAFRRALPVMRRRRIRYLTFQGGEPLVHPQIVSLVASATQAGMQCGLITNGWFLGRYVEPLAKAGLSRLLISIDSAEMAAHELNRGLSGLGARIRDGVAAARALGVPVCASVTVSRLVRYDALPDALAALGFDCVSFSYPRRAPFGSTSLVYDEDSSLIDLSQDELIDALHQIASMKKRFRVLDPGAALAEVERFVRGEAQRVPCIGGFKYFYVDWNLDIWRCEAWHEPMGSVFDLDSIPDRREPCNACMMSCYRHASVLMHGAICVTDAARALGDRHFADAVSTLFQQGVAYSLWALAVDALPRRMLLRTARPRAHADPSGRA